MKRKKVYIADIILLVIVAAVLAVTMAWSFDIELALGLCYYTDADGKITAPPKNGAVADGNTLNVHFVDVGQGDCCIIEFPDGATAIIDGGDRGYQDEITEFIETNLDSDFKYFDYCILTHPDADHCGSLDDVLNAYPARVSYRPNVRAYYAGTSTKPQYIDPADNLTADAVQKDGETYARAVKAMYEPTAAHDFTPTVLVTDPTDENQTIKGGIGDDEYSLTFYSPLSTKYTGEGDWNNYSPIMILEYRGYKFAMSGDAEERNLDEFADKVEAAKTDGVTDKYDAFTDDYCVNVVKAGHHGSVNATTTEYLEIMTSPSAVGNTYSVISCGEGNKYKHPHAAALEKIKAVGIKEQNILRTDISGDISFSVKTDGNGNYKLYYGDDVSPDLPSLPIDPDDPNNPDTPDTPEKPDKPEIILVYKYLGSVKLTWPLVAWVAYAVFVVLVGVHLLIVKFGSSGERTRGKGGRR